MKILITGGAGFVGTNLISELKNNKYVELFSIDNYSTGFRSNELEGVNYIDANIHLEHGSEIMSEIKPDVIYHLAALARIQPSFKFPTPTFEANMSGTQRVLEYARENKTPVIYAGSSSTHGGVHKNPYTFSKWVGEELCKLYSKVYDVPTIIARFYNVYGDHMIPGSSAYSTVIQIFNKQFKEGTPLTITGDGEKRRDFTHVLDICDALIKCMDHPEMRAEFFELGRGKNYSINEVADMYKCARTYIEERSGEARETLADLSKAKKLLDYNPKRNLEDFIKNVIHN